ncbi:MAG: TraB/GumN family protein [Bacteroidota bacterium]|jgi:uncharacterized protein YbaP (TraB family)
MRRTAILLILLYPAYAFLQVTEEKNELLWEITGNGLKNKSYLYGSLHANDKRLFVMQDSVYVALDRCSAIALETDIFSLFRKLDTRKEEVDLLFDIDGRPYTGSGRASRTMYGDENGMPQFLDAWFQDYCLKAGKDFYALESVEDQLNVLTDVVMPDAERINYVASQLVQEKMIELYLDGDIKALDKVMKVNLSVYPGSYEQIIVERNYKMTDGIDSLLRSEALFCVVGAGHLAGDEGVISLLRKKGYRVRNVEAVYTEVPIAEKEKVRSLRNYKYTNEAIGIMANFPGKPDVDVRSDGHFSLLYREFGQGNTYALDVFPKSEELTLKDLADIYIPSPSASNYAYKLLEDGTELYEGIADAYPEGYQWVRVMQNEHYHIVIKAYGGNKFMNSNRPQQFFNNVWFE